MDDARYLHHRIVFQVPERAVHPPSWLDHTPFAFWIIQALQPASFVELGCHSGNSYSSFAQAVQTLGLTTACYAVDTWQGDPHSGAFDESVFEEWAAYHDRHFASFSRLIRATFDEALSSFSDNSIDLLHIDGYHTYEAVAHDFESWRPKMSRRGVVLCHDVNVRERDFGVWRLWDRLKTEYPAFEFRHGHGLGVLGVGNELPDAVRWLLTLDADATETVRAFFSRLGAAVLARYEADEERRIRRAELHNAEQIHRAALDEAERTHRAELASREQRLEEAATQHAVVETENRQLREALKATEEALATRDAEVEELASRLEVREAQRSEPTIVVLSHVGASQPRAGNEYRLNRMLQWYRRKGYRLVVVIAPLPGEELSRDALAATAAMFGNAIQVHRDGRVEHDLRDLRHAVDAFSGPLRSVSDIIREPAGSTGRSREVLNIERTFCHDAVIATVLQLQQSLGPHILQAEYIWMTRVFPLLRGDVLKVVDTHDVFSTIEKKVSVFGLRDLVVDAADEAELLRRAQLIIAIQDEERLELQRMTPAIPVVTAGVDFDVVTDAEGSIDGQILYVASGNPRNRKGLDDFLRLAWPRIRQRAPQARLVVVGDVAKAIAGREVPGVTVLGAVDDTSAIYRDAALVINPVVAGTGAKIKTIEALSHLRPLVTWPAGVDGLDPRLSARCTIARDWYEFGNLVIDALLSGSARRFSAEDRAVIAELVSPETVYAALDAVYAAFFDRHRRTGSSATSRAAVSTVG